MRKIIRLTLLRILAASLCVLEARILRLPNFERCSRPLFVFGASYMDVGENAAAMPFRGLSDFLPYGMDYFGKATGRYSNGRLIIDHISQELGREFLSPYLRDMDGTFQHGVNFASAGSTARNSTFVGDGSDSSGLFSLAVQVDQFRIFHRKALEMHRAWTDGVFPLPAPEDFSQGVYIVESGNNDYLYTSDEPYDPDIISTVVQHIEHALWILYHEGARTIVVFDAIPRGCHPDQLAREDPHNLDEDGCWIPAMKTTSQHNAGLHSMIRKLNAELPGAGLVIFSLHNVFMSAIRNPSKFDDDVIGLKYVHKACCGYGGGDYNYHPAVQCGKSGFIDAEYHSATVCNDRSSYMMWDGMHPTDAFAHHIAQALVCGDHMQPPFRSRSVVATEANLVDHQRQKVTEWKNSSKVLLPRA